ncbi:MAG: hypothetical protein M1381_06755 [Deltaproteobacteria bacterium]|nr:hypothetical protein [Deltaproteobacteria bacterium]MCL5792944.1 hypothetical protein [Deltaproteobacteria bacterium]
METENVHELEAKINILIEKYLALKDEKNSLIKKIEDMQREIDELAQFKKDAVERIDKIINSINEVNL